MAGRRPPTRAERSHTVADAASAAAGPADPLPPEAWVVALASLSMMGPARLGALLDGTEPAEAWARVRSGGAHRGPARRALGAEPEAMASRWAREARALDPAQLWHAHRHAGVGVAIASSATYPMPFRADPDPPPVVFHRGDPDLLAGPRVAVVGTRSCTRYGHDLAFELGRDLAAAGVAVVSGLALGVDGAAHAGALEGAVGPPVGVVGSGLDVVYPRRNGPLWRAVAGAGLLLSEYPLGTPATAWHFPSRNRLIAALADLIVVVESPEKGGAMHTVEEAIRRGHDVLAVPGPVGAPASAGTNKLLFDGCGVVRDAADVLLRLGLSPGGRRRSRESRPRPTGPARAVLAGLGWQPSTLEQLALRTGLDLVELSLALDRLETDGWVARRGGWYERAARRDA